MKLKWKMSKKQKAFIESTADEVLFGGAAGGGKSYAQLMDAFMYAINYPGSKQLILRRTMPELKKSLIRVHLDMYPQEFYQYNYTDHYGIFKNGSIIDFGHLEYEKNLSNYQSAEYDVIRFDELTHFTEEMYTYMLSRIRGANDYPKAVKSSTNPGSVGHYWVKERFIDPAPPFKVWQTDKGTTRVFIPALVQENKMLMEKDPGYIKRLQNLSEKDKQALLYGNWDIYDGQYFTEWNKDVHVVKPFVIPKHWKKYFTMDYGLDMLAGYVIAVDTYGRAYVTKEIYKPNLIISAAAAEIKQLCAGEEISAYYAPPDMWNRRQDTGKSVAEIFLENGIMLTKSNNDRVHGWFTLKEYLKVYKDETGADTANLVFFENCRNAIRCMPALTFDDKNPNDVADKPHELTHAPDAVRYFVSARPSAAYVPPPEDDELSYEAQIQSFINF